MTSLTPQDVELLNLTQKLSSSLRWELRFWFAKEDAERGLSSLASSPQLRGWLVPNPAAHIADPRRITLCDIIGSANGYQGTAFQGVALASDGVAIPCGIQAMVNYLNRHLEPPDWSCPESAVESVYMNLYVPEQWWHLAYGKLTYDDTDLPYVLKILTMFREIAGHVVHEVPPVVASYGDEFHRELDREPLKDGEVLPWPGAGLILPRTHPLASRPEAVPFGKDFVLFDSSLPPEGS